MSLVRELTILSFTLGFWNFFLFPDTIPPFLHDFDLNIQVTHNLIYGESLLELGDDLNDGDLISSTIGIFPNSELIRFILSLKLIWGYIHDITYNDSYLILFIGIEFFKVYFSFYILHGYDFSWILSLSWNLRSRLFFFFLFTLINIDGGELILLPIYSSSTYPKLLILKDLFFFLIVLIMVYLPRGIEVPLRSELLSVPNLLKETEFVSGLRHGVSFVSRPSVLWV